MKKLETIQSRKTMSAYGGMGSIIETKDNGSLLIEDYTKWQCFKGVPLRKAQGNPINDKRLLKHLQQSLNPNITCILRLPEGEDNISVYSAKIRDLPKTIKSRYFPEWFFCPQCRQLHRLSTWEEKWNEKFQRDGKFKDNYPACYNCSTQRGNRISRKSLEQIRFCMASLDCGKLEDIPFEKLFANGVDLRQKGCDISQIQGGNDDFTYHTSATSDGLQSIYVKDTNDKRITMAQIASPYIITADGAFKVYVRNQNNLYYPNIIRSLYIPQDAQLMDRLDMVLRWFNRGKSLQEICDKLDEDYDIRTSPHDVQSIIDNNGLDFDEQEYYYITDETNYNSNGIKKSNDGDFYAILYRNLKAPFIKRMYAIPLLKETAVIPSYTRVSPTRDDLWWDKALSQEQEHVFVKRVFTYAPNNPQASAYFIPGVESYGEGIFLDIDVDHIAKDDRDIFVHTFSHIIMKEMEFQCGYPLSSLKEKLYDKDINKSHYGILIYTVGGSEGSYGGLVSLLPSDPSATNGGKLVTLIQNALERAKDCPNDPICINEEGDKQGHCFACVDIPEISCCKWNKDLNRRIVLKYAFPSTSESTNETESESHTSTDEASNETELKPHTSTNEASNIVTKNNVDEDDILA